jgi:hypothetical protein
MMALLVSVSGCNRRTIRDESLPGTPAALYRWIPGAETCWASFENPSAEKGKAGRENKGAKGHAFDSLEPGETKTLLNIRGSGIVNRMWCTLNDQSPELLRSLVIRMYWDDAPSPAVNAPLGDFFGHILGRGTPFSGALFADPNGQSFNCFTPMPFRTAARIEIVNESRAHIRQFYYDVNVTRLDRIPDDTLYFHACWRRENPTSLGEDFTILPRISGKGRYLGAHIGVIRNPDCPGWWGEGGIKVYLDGDREHPTLMGTGSEDYMGAAWGMPSFGYPYQGCLIKDEERGQFSFYRYHVPDPIWFSRDIRVTMQQIGCSRIPVLRELDKKGIPVKLHSLFSPADSVRYTFHRLLDRGTPPDLYDNTLPEGYAFYYRVDDWSAVAFFYLDSPENGLPAIAEVKSRTAGLLGKK